MNKKAIITRIGDLLEQECGVCPKKTLTNGRQSSYERVCSGCSTFEELQELGRFLNTDDDGEKVRRILAKGENMTTNEILYLLENDGKSKDILRIKNEPNRFL